MVAFGLPNHTSFLWSRRGLQPRYRTAFLISRGTLSTPRLTDRSVDIFLTVGLDCRRV